MRYLVTGVRVFRKKSVDYVFISRLVRNHKLMDS